MPTFVAALDLFGVLLNLIRTTYIPLLLLLLTGVGTPVAAQTEPLGTQLYIDDKNITPRAQFELRRDDLVRFDAYGLAASSSLRLEAKKKGLRFVNETYTANARGEVKAVLHFPKISARITCTAWYTTQNNEPRKIRFFLQPPPD